MTFIPKDQKKVVRLKGKGTWYLPEVINFEMKPHFYEVVDFRAPKKDEFFISGAIPEGFKCFKDLTQKYLIAVPTKAKAIVVWER